MSALYDALRKASEEKRNRGQKVVPAVDKIELQVDKNPLKKKEDFVLSLKKEEGKLGLLNSSIEEDKNDENNGDILFTLPENNSAESLKENDWSLSQIPGYQQYNKDQKKTKKILRVSSKNESEKNDKKVKLILVIGLFLIFLFALIFYALYYYEEKLEEVEVELKQYQLRGDSNSRSGSLKYLTKDNNKITEAKASKRTLNDRQKLEKQDANDLYLEKKERFVVPETNVEDLSNYEEQSFIKNQKIANKTSTNNPVRSARKNITKSPIKTDYADVNEDVFSGNDKNKSNRPTGKITIKKEINNKNSKKAFYAYEKGDYEKAKELYNLSLKENGNDLFALSGLGAIASKKGEFAKAISYYTQILKLEPNNKQAKKALLNLESKNDKDPSLKTKLEKLIQKSPNDPSLKFSLGNSYAKEGRWIEAQEQYFLASSTELSNPVYALNLAISLDQLGKHTEAVHFYRKALELSEIQGSSFDTLSVKQRIKVLKKFNKEVN